MTDLELLGSLDFLTFVGVAILCLYRVTESGFGWTR